MWMVITCLPQRKGDHCSDGRPDYGDAISHEFCRLAVLANDSQYSNSVKMPMPTTAVATVQGML